MFARPCRSWRAAICPAEFTGVIRANMSLFSPRCGSDTTSRAGFGAGARVRRIPPSFLSTYALRGRQRHAPGHRCENSRRSTDADPSRSQPRTTHHRHRVLRLPLGLFHRSQVAGAADVWASEVQADRLRAMSGPSFPRKALADARRIDRPADVAEKPGWPDQRRAAYVPAARSVSMMVRMKLPAGEAGNGSLTAMGRVL